MRIAFYAPMKPPHHPTPSGDRRMARLLMQALRDAGHTVDLASSFRSWRADPDGAPSVEHEAGREISLLQEAYARGPKPDLWFTYHLYHKAPDWIGPTIAEGLSIPYCVAEASVAPKQAAGPWAEGHGQVLKALARCDSVFFLNPNDRACVTPVLKTDSQSIDLKPFLDLTPFLAAQEKAPQVRQELTDRLAVDPNLCWLAAVGMMRPGAKRASYAVLADALKHMMTQDFRLLLIGDGPDREAIERDFAGDSRVLFLGALTPERLIDTLSACDAAVWPSIDEAFGLGLLEAQAAGLPVVSGETQGVANMVVDGETGLLTPLGDSESLSGAMATLIADPARRKSMGEAARAHVAVKHSLASASKHLDSALRDCLARFQAARSQHNGAPR